MTHALKTWPEFYKLVEDGSKTFEMRKFDRPFATGDTVILQEWNPETKAYTGKESTFKIGYLLSSNEFGLKKGICCFSLKTIENSSKLKGE